MSPTSTNSYVKILTLSVIIFGGEAYEEIIKVTEVIGWGPNRCIRCVRDT